MTPTGKYQTFDELTPEEFAALEADILARGVQVAIEFDEDGNVLDGHHRLAICRKHGITDFPSVVRRGLTEQEKRDHARRSNLLRRHLTREQRQAQIEQAIREHAGDSDRKIAASLNVDHKTVAAHRKRLVEGGEVPHQTERVGRNGMSFTPTERVPVDEAGGEIPQQHRRLFATRPDYVKTVNELREIKRRAIELCGTNPVLRCREASLRQHLDRLVEVFEADVCHVIHSACEGEGCDGCRGLGFLTAGEFPHQEVAE